MKKILIVGAGIFGATMAERIAADAGRAVTVIDRRPHIGGNCWSEIDPESGVECHKYGSHIFHTSNSTVWEYITRFTAFNNYRHTVWTTSKGAVYPLPVNLHTINSFYGTRFTPEQAREFVHNEAAGENITHPANLEEKGVSLIGRPLYETFFRGYTAKQWGKDPRELPESVITRLPVRYTYSNRYFADAYEGIPLAGYGTLFERMLAHPNIDVRLNTAWEDARSDFGSDALIIHTGPIDEFFSLRLGRLEWRTIDLKPEWPNNADFQGTSVMNYADEDVPWTRIHEYKHFHPERPDTGKTVIVREYPRNAEAGDEPFYPVETRSNSELLCRYQKLAAVEAPHVVFGGRLGAYAYLDMDDAVAAALRCYEETVRPRL
jgi:UDP-galactopyranose mutase